MQEAAGAPGNTKSVGAVAVTFYSATAQSSLTRMLAAPRQPGPGPGDWMLDGDNSGYSVHQSCHDKERGSRAAGGQWSVPRPGHEATRPRGQHEKTL